MLFFFSAEMRKYPYFLVEISVLSRAMLFSYSVMLFTRMEPFTILIFSNVVYSMEPFTILIFSNVVYPNGTVHYSHIFTILIFSNVVYPNGTVHYSHIQ